MKIKLLLLILLSVIGVWSCLKGGSEGTVEAYDKIKVFAIESSTCKSQEKKEYKWGNAPQRTTLRLKVKEGYVGGLFENLTIPCDFERVYMLSQLHNGKDLVLILYPQKDKADCLCPIDLRFTLGKLPYKKLNMKIFIADAERRYRADLPYFAGDIILSEGNEMLINL